MDDEAAAEQAPAEAPKGRLRRWLPWLSVAGVVAALVLGGLHVGATHPDWWYVRGVVWVVDGIRGIERPADDGGSSSSDARQDAADGAWSVGASVSGPPVAASEADRAPADPSS